jgi:hypothetical protein
LSLKKTNKQLTIEKNKEGGLHEKKHLENLRSMFECLAFT